MSRHHVGRLEDLTAGQLKLVEANGARVVLARVRDEVFACSDECTHQAMPLSAGEVMPDGTVECPWHGARYDCCSGAVRRGPAEDDVATFAVRVEDGRILVEGPER